MGANIQIRPLQLDDWENFKYLRLKALREDPKAYGISEADEADKPDAEWQALCQGEGKYYMVAEDSEGNLIGMLGALEIFGQLMRHQVELIQGYVDPKFRRQRVMERLFYSLKAELEKMEHLEQMIGWVTLHETQVSKPMLEKFGFKLAGTLFKTVKYQGKYYDCCWLEAPLRNIRPIATQQEKEKALHLRQKYFFDRHGIQDPYLWTFDHKDHLHFVLYKEQEIVGYIHLQLWPEQRAAIRIIVIDEPYRCQGLGKQLLSHCEHDLERRGIQLLQTESNGDAYAFYKRLGYYEMPFDDPEGVPTDPRDIAMGKELKRGVL